LINESKREGMKEGKKERKKANEARRKKPLPLSLRRLHGIVIVLFVADSKGLLM